MIANVINKCAGDFRRHYPPGGNINGRENSEGVDAIGSLQIVLCASLFLLVTPLIGVGSQTLQREHPLSGTCPSMFSAPWHLSLGNIPVTVKKRHGFVSTPKYLL